ncbi:MAG: FAD-dependent monooxygenase [Pseudomonadota bacterium]
MSQFDESSSRQTPVLIVGGGPIGMLAALMLAQSGIASTIVERRSERLTAPKAHAVNPRTLEICASLNVPVDEIYAAATPADEGGHVHFMATLAGTHFGSLPYERQDDAVKALTPFPLANIAQPKFEDILERQVNRNSAITLLRGVTCEQVVQDDQSVTATLRTGIDERRQLSSDYLLAADGANSRIRSQMDIAMVGPEAIEHFMMIHFKADLSDIIAEHPGILYLLMDPDAAGMLIAYDQAETWVLMHGCTPDEHDAAFFDAARCQSLIEAAVGQSVDAKVLDISPWTMSSQVASDYHRGRVFLVGDSAHRFPPAGGLGLNTGVGDAHNLCWKLASVMQGNADAELLHSYVTDRQPVAQMNSDQSLQNAALLLLLMELAHGSDPAEARQHFDGFCETGPGSTALEDCIDLQKPHFDSLNLQLGYDYSAEPQTMDSGQTDISTYRPSYRPGVRVPHSWVIKGDQRFSLLQLLSPTRFTLLVHRDRQDWLEAVNHCESDLQCLTDARDFTGVDGCWSDCLAAEGLAAILLRPDGHITRSFPTDVIASSTLLEQSLAHALRRPACAEKGAA